MISGRNYKILTYIFGCIHIFFILVILSQAAVPIVTDWIAAVSITSPCALNIVFALFWMIGTGMHRPLMINIFKYFSYGQMTVIAALTVWFVVQCVLNGGQFHLYLVIFIMMSLFVLSVMEVFVATGAHRAVLEDLVGARMRAVEMTEWNG
ncbi:conserved hypothetical protein [Culex quinquefasciatus]|uniref:Uncharacterized protein n=3 Tax=Culex pipiens complex TaxID=518105 RepID=B0XD00_CULQU|nr:uncharacterized protein LOC6051030 isoform X2 [Culex quinquefasciatus]XP_039441799.1 uncharacterized protein LOC120422436 isoform X2 [Culex pipiens pallens]XP_039441800.1 uncharacterized protein LOC120422436 isoform X2 [Culex pipiens pallens]EDS45195.1 conserved hypothetical protein [Culex quinquefasciatus]|eukprot:XP_001867522.1 conserved hypothetical protein [Culex quinquefasciatus]